MISAAAKAKVIEVGEQKTFDLDGKTFRLRNVLFDIGDGKLLRTDLWGDRTPPEVGQVLRISVEVSSERNKKDPSLFYHKIKLKHYEDYHKPLWKEDSLGERVRDAWNEDADWSP
jgi:hypothetical protein